MNRSSRTKIERKLIGNFYVEGIPGNDIAIRQLYAHEMKVIDNQGNQISGFSQTFTESGDHVLGPDDDGNYKITGTDIILVKVKIPF